MARAEIIQVYDFWQHQSGLENVREDEREREKEKEKEGDRAES